MTRIRTSTCELELVDQGAQVVRWRPVGGPDVAWTSPAAVWHRGEPVRAGVPLCFPWFGSRAGQRSHGFARTAAFRGGDVEPDGDGVRVHWILEPDADSMSVWPRAFRLEVTVRAGRSLSHAVRVENAEGTPLECELAIHGYFAVHDAATATVRGLRGAKGFDKVAGADVDPAEVQGFGQAVDLVCQGVPGRVTLDDPGWRRRIHVDRSGTDGVVVWNPGPAAALADLTPDGWRAFVCVETAAVGAGALALPPGGSHVISQEVTVEDDG